MQRREIDLDELLAELEAISEAPAKEDEMDEAHAKEDE